MKERQKKKNSTILTLPPNHPYTTIFDYSVFRSAEIGKNSNNFLQE